MLVKTAIGKDEIRKLAPEGVVIEDSILLRYKSPIYFFVHPDNDALHDRLLKGLNIAIGCKFG